MKNDRLETERAKFLDAYASGKVAPYDWSSEEQGAYKKLRLALIGD